MSAITIIERFGGVTRLADKLSEHLGTRVAPTTVQYWKDIDRIPGPRQRSILACGKQFGIAVEAEEVI